MRRSYWSGAVLGLGMILGAAPARGQAVPTPPPAIPPGLSDLSGRMADQVRHLADDIGAELAGNAEARDLAETTQELAQSLDEFRASAANPTDVFSLRRAYSGIDQTWHQLQGRLARPEFATPAVARAAGRVAEVDARMHNALGLNTYPADYYTTTRPPSGAAEVQRLAHALTDRAEALAALVRADMVGAGGRVCSRTP